MTTLRIFMAMLLSLTIFPSHRSEARQNAYYEEDYIEEGPRDEAPMEDERETVVQRPCEERDEGCREADHDHRRGDRSRRNKKRLSRKEYLKQFHYTTGEIKATTQGQSPRR